MSKSSKGPDYVVEEDDFFGSHIQKKIRKFKKKLKEIEDLEAKPESELNPSQREKIANKEEQEEGIRVAEELLRSYITAYVDALGESTGVEPKIHIVPGKKEQKKLEKKAAASKTQEKPAEKPVEKPAEKTAEKPAEKTEKPATKAPEPAQKDLDAGKLRNILNLAHFAQFFGNTGAIEDYQKTEGSQDHLNDVYHSISEFYNKVFSYTEASRFSTNDDKINSGVHELEQYLSRAKAPAVKNRSYADLFDLVEKVCATKHFHEKTAEFDKHHGHKAETKSYQAAIGSEARGTTSQHKEAPVATKEPAHTETHAPKQQPTQASPTVHKEQKEHKDAPVVAKEHKEAEPTKQEEKPQGKQAWHQIDSDEDEEEGQEHEQNPAQAQAQDKAPEKSSPEKKERQDRPKRQWEEKPKPTGEPELDEDGFIIVRSAKEKKEAQLAAERASRGQRRGGRGGPRRGGEGRGGPRRGGPRPPREGGQEGDEGYEGGEFRGGRGGQWRPKTEGGDGEGGRPWRGGRGGGDRQWRGRGGPRNDQEGRQEFQEKTTAPAPTAGN